MKHIKLLLLLVVPVLALSKTCGNAEERYAIAHGSPTLGVKGCETTKYKPPKYDKLRSQNYFDEKPIYNVQGLKAYKLSFSQLQNDPYFYQSCYDSQVQQQLITFLLSGLKNKQVSVTGNSIAFINQGTWNIYSINKVVTQDWNPKTSTLSCKFLLALSINEKEQYRKIGLTAKHINLYSNPDVKVNITLNK